MSHEPSPEAAPATPKVKTRLRLDVSTRTLVARLWREHIHRHIGMLLLSLLFMAVAAATTAGITFVIERVLDDVLIEQRIDMLWIVSSAMFGLGVLQGVAGFGHTATLYWVTFRMVRDVQEMMFARLMRADLAFFSEHATGTLTSRITHDTGLLRNALDRCVLGIGRDVLKLLGLVAAMFWRDWALALVAFVVIPLAGFPIARIGRRLRKVTINSQESMERIMVLLDETIRGNRQVKAYGMEAAEEQRFATATRAFFRLLYKGLLVRSLSRPVMETLAGASIAGVILFGGQRVFEGHLTPGEFMGFLTAALLTYQPLKALASLHAALQEGVAAGQRIYAMIDLETRIKDHPSAKPLSLPKGPQIRLEDIRFGYHAGEEPVLRGLTLEAPGECKVALVGPSGAGKSTILNLIPRFYDIDAGRILIDGTDIQEATLASLRRHIALVSQEVTLFDDSVYANIAYGRPDASQEAIEEAARLAGAHAFITELPEGYDTPVGPRGTRLSGGQAQRISIARAMLKDAPILLLDEATSALDTESERHIQEALRTLMRGRTSLVIAHRLSTVMDADIIYVIENGQVSEKGTHSELIARGGAYARLYRLQFAEQRAGDGEAGPADVS